MKQTIVSTLAVAGMVLTTAGLSAQQQRAESPVLDAESRALAVESVASIVEVNYPWPDTARMIAEHVRGRHASSAYDTISTLRDFAMALTRDLRAINGDLHLGVFGGSPMASPGPSVGSPADRPTGIDRFERLDGNVGYLKLVNLFNWNSAFDAVTQALDSLAGTDAMILDLRAVRGGFSQMSQFLMSHFMPPEVHYLTVLSVATGQATHRHTLDDVPGPRRLDVPLYVLVDRGSASAAEEAPFVLQQFGRATIVGERTAGAGRNVVHFPAELGLGVSLSTTRVYEPSSGREWERTGVLPDIVTTSEEALMAALAHARDTIRVTHRNRPAGR
jgi:retinol-binding protein 3